jgi:hypothetical protein
VDKAMMQLSQTTTNNNSVTSLSSFANIDHDRYTRTNFPEVIFAQGKSAVQVAAILNEMAERQIMKLQQTLPETNQRPQQQKRYIPPILATRYVMNRFVTFTDEHIDLMPNNFSDPTLLLTLSVSPELYFEILETCKFRHGCIKFNDLARIISMHADIPKPFQNNAEGKTDDNASCKKRVVVATAGTTDIPVAEEAAVTLEASDVLVDRIYDVGVAGLHRIINALPTLTDPKVGCIIVCAGMDGALPSVVGGLVQVPVIAVPTSIGYGAAFSGVSALLTMLNSCAPGVGVVNIDNGFGAAALAYKCIQ